MKVILLLIGGFIVGLVAAVTWLLIIANQKVDEFKKAMEK